MSAARQMLNLPMDSDDCALIGVPHRPTRAQIIHAAQGRLNAIAAHPHAQSQEAQVARLEIRDAAQRLAALAAKVKEQKSIQPRRLQFGSIAAAVLMRRNPRRAHMFLAQMKMDAPTHSSSPRNNARTLQTLVQREPEQVRKVPLLLVTFVVLSIVGFIVEIIFLRAQMQPTIVRKDSQNSQVIQEVPAADDSKSLAVKPAKVEDPIPAPVIESIPPSPIGDEVPIRVKTSSAMNEASRLLRNRWQRAARVAVEIPYEELALTAANVDPLEESLRQSILLERIFSLDLAARQLEAGDDRSASLLLDAISTDSSITIAARTPLASSASMEIDGELSKALERFPGTNQGRIALLRSFRTRPSPPGNLDAQTLVQEALKGPSRASRTIAQAILVDRGLDALNVLEAVEERFTELLNDPALSGMIRAFSGLDPNGIDGAPAARAAIIEKIIMLRGSWMKQLDITSQDIVTTLRKIATLMRISSQPKEASELLRAINPKYSTRQLRMGALNDAGVLHALVQNGTALLRDQASTLKVRRPADHAIIDQVVFDAMLERSRAKTALGQAIINARGILSIDAIQLGVPSLQVQADRSVAAPASLRWDIALPPEVIARWQRRLEALTPSNPVAYLKLAEEVADESNDASSQMLARQLYSLAGGLDAENLGTSAALGIADLEDENSTVGRIASQRWIAIAQRWTLDQIPSRNDTAGGVDTVGSAVRLGAVEAIVHYRRGYGRRANDRLKSPQVRSFFESFMPSVPGGVEEFDRLSAIYTKGTPPPLSEETINALLRVEHGLLRPKSLYWSDAISMGEGSPTFDAPIGTAAEIFGVDLSLNRWAPSGWIKGDVIGSDKNN